MKDVDKAKLDSLLRDLISAQDDVTHYNERKQIVYLRAAQEKRDRIRDEIKTFVEELAG